MVADFIQFLFLQFKSNGCLLFQGVLEIGKFIAK